MPILCYRCQSKGYIKRPKTGHIMCKECFSWCFEEEIHWTIVHAKLITRGDKIAIGASGGKDSTVLAYILNLLNKRYDYGAELLLLSIDEGISGYRDDSLMTVKRNQIQYALPLKILSYQELYGWSMDDIVKRIGNKRNCTYCGIFRRQALDKGALLLGANKICTGHNADDIAETVLMNILRGDIGRLKRCAAIMTVSSTKIMSFQVGFAHTHIFRVQMIYFPVLNLSNMLTKKKLSCMHICISWIIFQLNADTRHKPIGDT
ncbi:Cytoplasmic tRNA 2-thiolation protein isoform 2 [Schistosoma japonicum]|uniref:Cytoplasmic tRNA 2-thiolation protein isoform 2 n=1 Tax=Schistosoma japonicum TaxID=6182 RepID=A0A4Z2CYN6_SCHJA|nr:Cytoplasmic tRNA 2-thiolation protein isoform 2 [Schistosoma japonicum]